MSDASDQSMTTMVEYQIRSESGGIAAADADRELDLLEGDLVFVMACTEMAAVEKHANDPQHIAMRQKFAEQAGVQVEPKFLRTVQATGRGFLWKD